jgi:hypothetical protein
LCHENRRSATVILTGASTEDPQVRSHHTHHVTVTNAEVSALANGFRVSGTGVITVNGSVAPFSGSPVQVDITGGNAVTYSNIQVTFAGAAAGHFGPHPLDGVVVTAK